MHATHPLPAGRVLGVYVSMTMLPSEELHLRHHPPESYPKNTAHWRQAIDAYAAELAPPPQKAWGKKLLRDVFDTALQVRPGFANPVSACCREGLQGRCMSPHRMLPSKPAVTPELQKGCRLNGHKG